VRLLDAESLGAELRELLTDVIGVTGALVATADGMLVAAEVEASLHAESIAALAAATSGVGSQFAYLMRLGELGGTVVQGTKGCVAVHPVGDNAILVLFGTDGPNVARLHLAVRQALPRIEAAMRGRTRA
jgi:predicted regulator of Ras-like GTPase activity (Roadblock/LC7/MglB family)